MQAGQRYGMQTMNQALLAACLKHEINKQQALERSTDLKELQQMFDKQGLEAGRPHGAGAHAAT
jgi:Tfp pilus assembly pilus retraction ATPase PilT